MIKTLKKFSFHNFKCKDKILTPLQTKSEIIQQYCVSIHLILTRAGIIYRNIDINVLLGEDDTCIEYNVCLNIDTEN